MGIGLYPYQEEAIRNMKNGCILCGGVGSGKSRTGLAYYFFKEGGMWNKEKNYIFTCPGVPRDLYIITTARKRDTLEWEGELVPFHMTIGDNKEYGNTIVVDSWNNIKKYTDVKDAFFIFDEQRVVGYGAWTKSFLKITASNQWILLSATPGDCWSDYIPVFIANGFYKNKTEFLREHAIFNRFSKYPKIDRYINTGKLIRFRNDILVNMDFHRQTIPHNEHVACDYDILKYKELMRDRFDYVRNKPIENASELCLRLREIVNSDKSRIEAVKIILEQKQRAIIFYNYDYELEILKTELEKMPGLDVAEWNGHCHQDVPLSSSWAYLVQYNAGAEGWNCIRTDTIIFYSQNYSYKIMQQSAGRIDRLNTPYTDLYFYHLKSSASIDQAIARALNSKKKFNENAFAGL